MDTYEEYDEIKDLACLNIFIGNTWPYNCSDWLDREMRMLYICTYVFI